MNEQNFPQSNEPIQSSKNIWKMLGVSVVITALIIGGTVFTWQKSVAEKKLNDLQQQINDLLSQQSETKSIITNLKKEKSQIESEITNLNQKYCKGTWKNGACTIATCMDSDVNKKPDDIYIKGYVTYTDENGMSSTIYDECTGSKEQVNEMWCYESPSGSGNYVQGRMVYDCPNGCLDGACIK